MEQVSPTRMNLLTKKAQIGLATQGVDLLKKKRDALVKEFFSVVGQLLDGRDKLNQIVQEAYTSLLLAKAVEGDYVVDSVSLNTKQLMYIEMTEKSVWGVKVPDIKKVSSLSRSVLDRGYGIVGVSPRIDRTAELFENIFDVILSVAAVEIHLKRLGTEIKKTTRRVNALEQNLVPKLKLQVRYIKNTLEERAREDTFRLKRIKQNNT